MGQLREFLAAPHAHLVGTPSIVSWYLNCGLFSMEFSRPELEAALRSHPSLQEMAMRLTEDEISQGKPPPELGRGDTVEVVVNAKNTTSHVGTIIDVAWHYKERKWFFIIEENGRKVGKRYTKEDLRPVGG